MNIAEKVQTPEPARKVLLEWRSEVAQPAKAPDGPLAGAGGSHRHAPAGERQAPAGKRRTGRPVIFDAVKQATCCALVGAGWSRRRAALLVGVCPSTITHLAARDAAFRKRLLESEARCVLTPQDVIMQASRHSWRAAAWLVEQQERAGRRGVRPRRRVLQQLLAAMKNSGERLG